MISLEYSQEEERNGDVKEQHWLKEDKVHAGHAHPASHTAPHTASHPASHHPTKPEEVTSAPKMFLYRNVI